VTDKPVSKEELFGDDEEAGETPETPAEPDKKSKKG
jgi:hypothetical protein